MNCRIRFARWFLLAMGCAASRPVLAQTPAAPPEVKLELRAPDGRTEFHLGERIQLLEVYTTAAPGKYSVLDSKLEPNQRGLHPIQVAPAEYVVARNSASVSAEPILMANCATGSTVAPGPVMREHAEILGAKPVELSFELTAEVQLTRPGVYTLQATRHNIRNTATKAELTVEAKPLQITVVEDPGWSHSELEESASQFEIARGAYESMKPAEKSPDASPSQAAAEELQRKQLSAKMHEAARNMSAIDTEESLARIVGYFDGSIESEQMFWQSIQESRHRRQVLDLLSNRMLQPDFRVTPQFLEAMTAFSLESEQPFVYRQDTPDSRKQLSSRARDILKSQLLALAPSINSKDPAARDVSRATFLDLAKRKYCAADPILDPAQAAQLLQ